VKRRSRLRTDSRSRPLEETHHEPEELDFAFDDTDEVFPESRHTFSHAADAGWDDDDAHDDKDDLTDAEISKIVVVHPTPPVFKKHPQVTLAAGV